LVSAAMCAKQLSQALWQDLGTAVLWAASLCTGLASGMGCKPYRLSCIPYLPISVVSGSILFIAYFAAEVVCVMLVLRIAGVRRWLLRPAPILAIVVLQLVIGYIVVPAGAL
jgi:hypothetical protein